MGGPAPRGISVRILFVGRRRKKLMGSDDARENEPVPSRPLHGEKAALAWSEFCARLLGLDEARDVDAPAAPAERSGEFTDEMLDAIEDITALRTGKIKPQDVDSRAVARWIQLFGLEALRMMLAIPGTSEKITESE
jgi:hypothetical protein